MSLIDTLIDYYSQDFSNLDQSTHAKLSSILSTLQSQGDEDIEDYEDYVVEHIYLPNKQPNISKLLKIISKQLEFNFVQLCVDFYTIKNNKENNKNLCEKSFDKLEDILWKLHTHPNKSEKMDEEMWSQLRPKDLYVLDRNTRTMILKTKAPVCSMPRKPCTIQFLIDRINKLFNSNKDHIKQIRHERAEQERAEQEALEQEALELQSPESTHEVSPTWDHEPLSTSLISDVQIVDTGGEVVLYHDEEPEQDEPEQETEPVEEEPVEEEDEPDPTQEEGEEEPAQEEESEQLETIQEQEEGEPDQDE